MTGWACFIALASVFACFVFREIGWDSGYESGFEDGYAARRGEEPKVGEKG